MHIPQQWTFRDKDVAAHFDQHVREQLPWYDLATNIAAHVGRHYLCEGGLMYDIGASTGNITRSLEPEITSRNVTAISIDYSPQMADLWQGVGTFEYGDIRTYPFQHYDFAVCFLVLMFIAPEQQRRVIDDLVSKIRPVGSLLIVDKTLPPAGYIGTVMHRLALAGKIANGAPAEEVLQKELSLMGVQRPLCPSQLLSRHNAIEVFRFGEFAGWVIEG
jgi:tRNA (cmo5U34)-methyltransferase